MYLQVIHYYDPERTETTAAYNTRVAGSGRADSKPVAEKWSKQSKPTNKTKKGGSEGRRRRRQQSPSALALL